jgi:hypothetical protein
MSTTRDPSAVANDDRRAQSRPGRVRRWIRAHIVPIALAILAGGLGGVVLYVLIDAF